MNLPSARSIIIAIIVFILFSSVLSWFPSPDVKDVARFFINCTLCWFLFNGKNWARWTLVVLLAMAGTMLIFAILVGPPGIERVIVLYVMAFVDLVSAGLLAFSRTVAGHFSTPAVRGDS